MHISVISLDGAALRYALAVTLKLDFEVFHIPVYKVGQCILVKGARSYFRPDKDWTQAGPLITEQWWAITAWLRTTYGDDWDHELRAEKNNIHIWFLRAIVGYHHGTAIDIPDTFL